MKFRIEAENDSIFWLVIRVARVSLSTVFFRTILISSSSRCLSDRKIVLLGQISSFIFHFRRYFVVHHDFCLFDPHIFSISWYQWIQRQILYEKYHIELLTEFLFANYYEKLKNRVC